MRNAALALALFAVVSLFGSASAQAASPEVFVLTVPLQPASAACLPATAPVQLSQIFAQSGCDTFLCKEPCRDTCQSIGCRAYCVSLEDCSCDCECW